MRTIEEAAVAAAHLLSRCKWRQPDGKPYPDRGWCMMRGATIALFFVGFAEAYGMAESPIASAFPEVDEKTRAAVLALVRKLRPGQLTPEHFGHVHEVLVGYGLERGKVTPTSGRRKTGAHFTPAHLAHKVMRTTVRPLLRCLIQDHGFPQLGARLLHLRICDPAVGAGAFLLALVRYLSRFVFMQGGAPTRQGAKQLVALNVAYGVDKDRYAAFATKLALTLECRPRNQSAFFAALDDNVRCGDALVGLDREQVVSMHWKRGAAPIPEIAELWDKAIAQAASAREMRLARASAQARHG